MKPVKGNSRSTISTKVIIIQRSWYWITNPKNRSETNILHQILILIMEKHHKNKFEKHPYMYLGAETYLQSQRHTGSKQLWDKVSTHKLIADARDLFSSGTRRQYTDFSLISWSYKKFSQTHSSSLFRPHLVPTLPQGISNFQTN